jgi:hypothetical protein
LRIALRIVLPGVCERSSGSVIIRNGNPPSHTTG